MAGSLCTQGYGANFDFKCKECASYLSFFGIPVSQTLAITGYLLFNVALCTAFSHQSVQAAESDSERFTKSHVNVLVVIAMTGISYFQSMSFLHGFKFVWPSAIGGFLDFFQSISGSFQLSLSMECMLASIGPQP